MQSHWPGLPNWVFVKVIESSSLSESGQKWSRADSVSPGHSQQSSQPRQFPNSARTSTSGQMSHFNFSPSAGKAAIGGGLAAVLEAAGGLLRFLGRGGSSKFEKRRGHFKRISNQDVKIRTDIDVLKIGGRFGSCDSQMEKRIPTSRPASLLLNKVACLLMENLGKIRNRNALPTVIAAILPPITHSPANLLPFHTNGDIELEGPCLTENFEETKRLHENSIRPQPAAGVIVEPRTGLCFPVYLEGTMDDLDSSHQVLAGVGARDKKLMKLKSIMVYAFGLYVEPDHLRAKIGDKYSGVSPEKLKYSAEFYEDLLSHGANMTIRLVVHFKGLKMGMVRSAFETSLKARLRKIEGAEDDNGLRDFCSLLSEDVTLSRGTTIDFRWQSGGALQAEVGGQRIGTISSNHLCRAFFDMYIGDPAVSEPAKRAIGETFARILTS